MSGRPKVIIESMKVPGPAAYNVNYMKGNKGCKFGTSSANKARESKTFAPGPGQYETRTKYKNFKTAAPAWKYIKLQS